MKRIVLIIPYFGSWPIWFDAFLVSVAKNPSVNWFCPTDCEIPGLLPKNITFLKTSLEELNIKMNAVVGVEVPLTPRKLCDLKPAYGDIFKDDIEGYDFWGICDMDIIWGDIKAYITQDILENYDIISSRKEAISGHFTLFRNERQLNALYKELPNYKELLGSANLMRVDEKVLTDFIRASELFKDYHLNVYWPKILCNQERGRDSWQGYYLDKWVWRDGKVVDNKESKEIMYLHFISWKRKMKFCNITYNNKIPDKFYISYKGIHEKPHPISLRIINAIKNTFYGFWFREKVKDKKKRFLKKLNRKIKSI